MGYPVCRGGNIRPDARERPVHHETIKSRLAENDRSPNAEIENLLINPQPLYQHGRYAIPKRSEATKRRKHEVREVKPLPFGALERVKRGDDADLS